MTNSLGLTLSFFFERRFRRPTNGAQVISVSCSKVREMQKWSSKIRRSLPFTMRMPKNCIFSHGFTTISRP